MTAAQRLLDLLTMRLNRTPSSSPYEPRTSTGQSCHVKIFIEYDALHVKDYKRWFYQLFLKQRYDSLEI